MEKPSFNGGALRGLLIIAVLIGAAVAAYFFFLKPKADFEISYKDFYAYDTNEKIESINSTYINTVISKMSDCKTKIATQVTKDEIDEAISKDTTIKSVISYEQSFDDLLLETLSFLNDNDEKLANKQKEMSKSLETLTNKANDCYTYYNTYLVNIDSLSYSADGVWQKIIGFNNTYFDYAKSLTNFYTKVSNIFNGYVKDQFKVNSYSKQNLKLSTLWANNIVMEVVNNKDANLTTLSNSALNLKNFINSNVAKQNTYLANKIAIDQMLVNLNNVDITECIKHLVNNDYDVYVASLEAAEIKLSYEILGQDYFLVLSK